MSVVGLSEQWHERVRSLIDETTSATSLTTIPEHFDALACNLARFQAAHVPAVARLMAARRVEPARLTRAEQIPAMPCDAFRHTRIAAHSPDLDLRVFRTSGTTGGREARGEHALRTTQTYRAAALAWGRRMLWPDLTHLGLIGLVPSEKQARDSSLSFMLARFAEQLGGTASWHVHPSARGELLLDASGVAEACAQARARAEPVLVAGTAFAFVQLGDACGPDDDLGVPPASRLMLTGGFKGRSRAVDPAALHRQVATAFALEHHRVVGEYGMTELSSQLYTGTFERPQRTAPTRFFAPPWTRVSAVDPVSLQPVAPGQEGLCRVVDLANVDSAVAIQTADLVRQHSDGSIELLGRAAGSTPRGCSLAWEDA